MSKRKRRVMLQQKLYDAKTTDEIILILTKFYKESQKEFPEVRVDRHPEKKTTIIRVKEINEKGEISEKVYEEKVPEITELKISLQTRTIEAKEPPLIPISFMCRERIKSNAETLLRKIPPIEELVLSTRRKVKAQIIIPRLEPCKLPLRRKCISMCTKIPDIVKFKILPKGKAYSSISSTIVPIKLTTLQKVTAKRVFPDNLRINLFSREKIRAVMKESIKLVREIARGLSMRGFSALEMLFPDREKQKVRKLLGAAGTYYGEPIIVLMPKQENIPDMWYLMWVICRELYRIAKGGYPDPLVVLKRTEDLKLWLKFQGHFGGKIVVLHGNLFRDLLKELEDLRKEERGDKGSKEIDELLELLERRLKEMFSQGLGFLIIITDEVERLRSLLVGQCAMPHVPAIIDITEFPEYSQLIEACIKVFGEFFASYSKEFREGLQKYANADMLVSYLDRAYRNFVEEMLTSNYIANVRRDVSERESEDHVAMKILVVKYLHETLNVGLDEIECTVSPECGGQEIIADVYVKNKALAIECETLFGEASSPLLKIFESARKYLTCDDRVKEVWIVIRNWPAMMFAGDLYWIEKVLKKEFSKHRKDIIFFVPDIASKKLVPLDHIISRLVSQKRSP